MGKQSVKIIAAVVVGLLSIPAVFLVSFGCFWRMVQAEYASGASVSTDGDTVTIPAVGMTTAWTVLLLAGVGVLLVMRIVRKGKRGAAVEQADEATIPPQEHRSIIGRPARRRACR
jgi:TRAP-type mannitol/chloroaromatic compound transport system permease small subunit